MSKDSSPTTGEAFVRRVKCPRCGGDSVYAPSNAYRPFCSEHCKNIDLGAWSSESFRLPDQPPTDGSYDAEDSLPL